MSGQGRVIEVLDGEKEVISRLCQLIEKSAKEAISKRSSFNIAVSGASLIGMLCSGLPKIDTEWSKWNVFFCDERLVSSDDKESTYGLYRDKLLPLIPLSSQQLVSIDFSLIKDPLNNAKHVAQDYEDKLRKHFPDSSLTICSGVGYPSLDVAVLGMGPDGHTCSLFPGHKEALSSTSWVIPIVNSPKPPPWRITLSAPLVNCSRLCIFTVVGSSKAETIKKVLEIGEDLPANLIKPLNGPVHWILDKESSSHLSSNIINS